MRDFALLLLGVALAFASLAWGGYWLQRRRALKRGGLAHRALPGPEPTDFPPPSPAAGELTAPGAGPAAPERRAEPEPAAVSRNAELGPAASSRDAEFGPTAAAGSADRRQTSGKGPRGAGPVEFLDEDTANAVEAAASAAASASAAAPGAAVVSVEPTSPSETAVAAAKPAAGADRAPAVVLVHGILGFDQFRLLGVRFHYFRGVADHLRGVGVNAYVVRLPALDAIPARGLALAEFVKSLPHDRVTLIAHSMGGLDARYAITHLGLAERVPVVVTVATPHHGTPLADLLARRTVSAARRFASKLGVRSEAIECLTTERMARFNAEVPDMPGVTYACVPCGRRARPGAIHPLLRPTYRYLRHVAGPNDGLVPVSSQLWGKVVEEIEADHWAQVGWSSRFDAPLFYADIVVHLAKLGLLPPPSFAELPAARSPLRLGPAPLPTGALTTGADLTTRPNE
jgi:triacylglycerol lipase